MALSIIEFKKEKLEIHINSIEDSSDILLDIISTDGFKRIASLRLNEKRVNDVIDELTSSYYDREEIVHQF